MYSLSVYNSYHAYSEMRTYCRRDNVSKIFREVQAEARKELALTAPTKGCEVHIVKIWGHGVVKLFEAKIKRDVNNYIKVSLKTL